MKIVTPTEMARLESDAADFGFSTNDLMEQAGLAIAQEIRMVLGGTAGRRILTLVGPGNNGGDGLVAGAPFGPLGRYRHSLSRHQPA